MLGRQPDRAAEEIMPVERLLLAQLSGELAPNPWLDDREQPSEFQQEKLDVFEAFRDRYVGRGGIVSATRD